MPETPAARTATAVGPVPELPETMRAAVYDGPGDPSVLRIAQVPRVLRLRDEVLVEVIAAGVNPLDVKTRAGRGVTPGIADYPAVLGLDFSGVVVQAPYAAHPLQPGDEVYGLLPFPRSGGAYAEYVSAPSLAVARKPSSLSHVEAAAVPCAALTAWGMVVEIAKVHEGSRVLVHAGAGGVGHFAVQFAAYFGGQVTATASTENAAWLHSLGAHRVIDYRTERFEDVLDEVDVVIDLVGNVHDDTGSRSLGLLRPGGILVNAPTGSWPTLADEAAAAGVRASGFQVAGNAQTLSVIGRLIESGDVSVHVSSVHPLEQAAEAHAAVETGRTRGKRVLRVREG